MLLNLKRPLTPDDEAIRTPAAGDRYVLFCRMHDPIQGLPRMVEVSMEILGRGTDICFNSSYGLTGLADYLAARGAVLLPELDRWQTLPQPRRAAGTSYEDRPLDIREVAKVRNKYLQLSQRPVSS